MSDTNDKESRASKTGGPSCITSANEVCCPLQLGRTYALTGDTAKARTAYPEFLSLWKDVDLDIPSWSKPKQSARSCGESCKWLPLVLEDEGFVRSSKEPLNKHRVRANSG